MQAHVVVAGVRACVSSLLLLVLRASIFPFLTRFFAVLFSLLLFILYSYVLFYLLFRWRVGCERTASRSIRSVRLLAVYAERSRAPLRPAVATE